MFRMNKENGIKMSKCISPIWTSKTNNPKVINLQGKVNKIISIYNDKPLNLGEENVHPFIKEMEQAFNSPLLTAEDKNDTTYVEMYDKVNEMLEKIGVELERQFNNYVKACNGSVKTAFNRLATEFPDCSRIQKYNGMLI